MAMIGQGAASNGSITKQKHAAVNSKKLRKKVMAGSEGDEKGEWFFKKLRLSD